MVKVISKHFSFNVLCLLHYSALSFSKNLLLCPLSKLPTIQSCGLDFGSKNSTLTHLFSAIMTVAQLIQNQFRKFTAVQSTYEQTQQQRSLRPCSKQFR